MNSNFTIETDFDGNMPRLLNNSRVIPKRAFTRYVNNRPVLCRLYPGQDRIWDYSVNEMFAVHANVMRYDGSPMPKIKGCKFIK